MLSDASAEHGFLKNIAKKAFTSLSTCFQLMFNYRTFSLREFTTNGYVFKVVCCRFIVCGRVVIHTNCGKPSHLILHFYVKVPSIFHLFCKKRVCRSIAYKGEDHSWTDIVCCVGLTMDVNFICNINKAPI